MEKSKVLLLALVLLANPVFAKFCSECGKPLPSENAKFCSECGAQIEKKTEAKKKGFEFVAEKLKSCDEFCVYLAKSSLLMCSQKYAECDIVFNEGLKELAKSDLDEKQKSLAAIYVLKWAYLGQIFKRACKNIQSDNLVYWFKELNVIQELLVSGKRSEKWVNKNLERVNLLQNTFATGFKVTTKTLYASYGLKSAKVLHGEVLHAVDYLNNELVVVLPQEYSARYGKITKEEMLKRTNIKDRLGTDLQRIEKLNKEIELLAK